MRTYELTPLDGRKSFYKKCSVIENGKTARLYSYDTLVAEFRFITREMKVHGWYSATTARHINAFLVHFGYARATKKQMENWNSDSVVQ